MIDDDDVYVADQAAARMTTTADSSHDTFDLNQLEMVKSWEQKLFG